MDLRAMRFRKAHEGEHIALGLVHERGEFREFPAMPSTSRTPSVFTATAIITATETIRPASRTFR
jgi:hypothetical protein